MKKIGLYGGTFDPIHFGHLNLAFEIMEKASLDEVWFIPAQVNPHKLETTPVLVEHRLMMLKLALEDIPQFKIIEIEIARPPPSYTIDTLRTLIAEEAVKADPAQFYLLLGEDSIPGFFRWRSVREIIEMVPLLIGSRKCHRTWSGNEDSDVRKAIEAGMVATRVVDFSSTEIRERLKENLYCGHLIPAKALTYLLDQKLYL